MKFVATKTADQLDLQALHRVRERLSKPAEKPANQGFLGDIEARTSILSGGGKGNSQFAASCCLVDR
jgi:hypothetical protein